MKRFVAFGVIFLLAALVSGKEEGRDVQASGGGGTKPELVIQNGHFDKVNSVSFSPDGKTLASGSVDTTIKFWRVQDGRLLCTLLPLDKEEWVVYTPEGYFDVSKNGKRFIGWRIGLEAYPAEKFWDGYYRPGLWKKALRGKEVK